MIQREELAHKVRRDLMENPIVVLYGPRQCGKTTLARQIADSSKATYFDLEDFTTQRRLAEPTLALSQLHGLVVID